ncbi:MAG TPA: hypothetical protein VKX16_17165 [Chloroflexota bacterium]|nr:hypothetical protein [Chloroflexota bacterium]
MAPTSSNRPRSEPDVFAPDTRPGADEYVYCKGCGTQLELRARLAKPKAQVDTMMCKDCIAVHGHRLMPAPGAPTFCYRCGGREEIFEAPGISPAVYHICPRCLPERAARYRSGDFEVPMRTAAPEEEAAAR